MEKSKRYTIGEISKITGLSITTLRFYDKKKLFQPEIRDEFTNYRYYSDRQILIGALVYEYRAVGYSIESMKAVLTDLNIESFLQAQAKSLALLDGEIKVKQRQIGRIKNICNQTVDAIQNFKPRLPLNEQVVFSVYPPKTILFNRMESELVSAGLWWDRYLDLLQIRDREGLTVCGPLTAIFHVPYTKRFSKSKEDLELFFPICDGNVKSPNVRRVEGMLTASLVYQGDYRTLFTAYTDLLNILTQKNYSVSGPPMEEYLIELVQTRNPEEYMTRIHLPVKRTACSGKNGKTALANIK